MIVVASIPHSGTRFVLEHLLAPRKRVKSAPDDGEFFFEHLDSPHIPKLRDMMRQFPCIVPMRHPKSIALSWKADSRLLTDLTTMYRCLVSAIDPFKPCYLPLDVENRDAYLQLLNDQTGLNLKTDWPIIGASGVVGRFDAPDYGFYESLMDELSDFFGRFSYEP